jgi:hypothetical protein
VTWDLVMEDGPQVAPVYGLLARLTEVEMADFASRWVSVEPLSDESP